MTKTEKCIDERSLKQIKYYKKSIQYNIKTSYTLRFDMRYKWIS